jgi:hypothetical protein
MNEDEFMLKEFTKYRTAWALAQILLDEYCLLRQELNGTDIDLTKQNILEKVKVKLEDDRDEILHQKEF